MTTPKEKAEDLYEQMWAKEDLKVTHFRNGEPIPLVQDDDEWSKLTTAAYCVTKEGNYLYNWYAVNDPRGLAPEGWHVPTDEEWTALTDHLGGEDVAGKNMKSSHSDDLSWNGNNSSGFSGLLGGLRFNNGDFHYAGDYGYWWSSSPYDSYAWYRELSSGNDYVNRYSGNLQNGFSVRCLMD